MTLLEEAILYSAVAATIALVCLYRLVRRIKAMCKTEKEIFEKYNIKKENWK